MRPEPVEGQEPEAGQAQPVGRVRGRSNHRDRYAPSRSKGPTPGGRRRARPTTPSWARSRTRAAAPGAKFTVTDIRRLWPEVLEEVKNKRRFT